MLDDPASFGIKDYNVSLGTYYSKDNSYSKEQLQQMRLNLYSYSPMDLSVEEQLTYDILCDSLDTRLSFCNYELYAEPLSFSGGMQIELPLLLAEYTFDSEKDVNEYLTLLSQMDDYLDSVVLFEEEKSKAGLFMSKELCQLTIDSCEAFLAKKDEHYLLSTFEQRLNTLNLSNRKKDTYIKKNTSIFHKQIVPAYEKMIASLNNLQDTGKNSLGLCHFPNGTDYYKLLVYESTGCDDAIGDIYERIEAQRINDLLVCLDMQEINPTLFEECEALEYRCEDPTSALKTLETRLLADFPQAPSTNYSIKHVDPVLSDYLAPAFYIVAPIDNYMDNAIYINDADNNQDIYYFTTLAHEGFPGHLYQTVMSYEYHLMPIRSILNYSGYVEGWATYIEMLSYDYANINEDVASFLSHNQAATLSLYASADIGLHYYGWDEADMYQFWSSYGICDEAVIKEITQLLLAEPGNYLKYYVGYIEFLDLKNYAKDLLGSDYSTIEFHRAILDIGPAPFEIIKKYFADYYCSPHT